MDTKKAVARLRSFDPPEFRIQILERNKAIVEANICSLNLQKVYATVSVIESHANYHSTGYDHSVEVHFPVHNATVDILHVYVKAVTIADNMAKAVDKHLRDSQNEK
jgi:hypothetical protein